ncbi:hypothetical protein FB451DRAFT_1519751 [Mycena latifolia]|nr:hypothetical protein FB451DRAFT_1519751 [Mycena latifolia]
MFAAVSLSSPFSLNRCCSQVVPSHLEQADNVTRFSTTVEGLQRKLDLFFGCATKTEWMLFGELPSTIPLMVVGDKSIRFVDSYKFVGIIFTSVECDIFVAYYVKKASKARIVVNTTFGAKTMIGCLSPYEGIRLYNARIKPHLIFGSEVRALSPETGVTPVAYHRPWLALGYLIYLITLPLRHLAKVAYLDSLLLSAAGHASWFSDLHIVLQRLPPIQLPYRQLEVDDVVQIRTNVTTTCAKWLGDLTLQYASHLPLIQERLEKYEKGNFFHMAVKFRHYLSVPIPAHHKALTCLFLSSHTLAIEILRYKEQYRVPTPFCHRAVKSESHALLGCMSDAF